MKIRRILHLWSPTLGAVALKGPIFYTEKVFANHSLGLSYSIMPQRKQPSRDSLLLKQYIPNDEAS
jgi:hypothetical protein